MKIKRVLTIESVDDETTRKTLKMIYDSNEFRDYIIEHFFFLKNNKDTIGKTELFKNLDEIINKFEPQAILIHTGIYFFKNKEAFLYAIHKLKAKYSNILFGIERRNTIENKLLSILDDCKELRELENVFFRINR